MSRAYESCLKSLPQGCMDCVFNYNCAEKELYEKGKEDAIDEAIHHLDNCTTNCHEDYIDGVHFSIGVLEQLKEQNK